MRPVTVLKVMGGGPGASAGHLTPEPTSLTMLHAVLRVQATEVFRPGCTSEFQLIKGYACLTLEGIHFIQEPTPGGFNIWPAESQSS